MHAAIRAGHNEAQAAGRLRLLQVSSIWALRTRRRRGRRRRRTRRGKRWAGSRRGAADERGSRGETAAAGQPWDLCSSPAWPRLVGVPRNTTHSAATLMMGVHGRGKGHRLWRERSWHLSELRFLLLSAVISFWTLNSLGMGLYLEAVVGTLFLSAMVEVP